VRAKKNGIDVLNVYRKSGGAAPVIILTACDAVEDRIHDLDAGADDYLIRPFDLDELAARVRALLRRRTGQKQPIYAHDELTLDPAAHEFTKAGEVLPPVPREFALLHALIEEPKRVFTKPKTGRKVIWLGRGGGQQRHRSACAQLAAQDRRGPGGDCTRSGLSAEVLLMTATCQWLLGWQPQRPSQRTVSSQTARNEACETLPRIAIWCGLVTVARPKVSFNHIISA
jgi:hypothetical protein